MDKKKPKCKLIGSDGNIFNILGIAGRALKDNGMREEAEEMYARVTSSGSYYEALGIITEYVDDETMSSDEDYDDEDYEDSEEMDIE